MYLLSVGLTENHSPTLKGCHNIESFSAMRIQQDNISKGFNMEPGTQVSEYSIIQKYVLKISHISDTLLSTWVHSNEQSPYSEILKVKKHIPGGGR